MWPWTKIENLENEIFALTKMRQEMEYARWWLDGEAQDALDWALNNWRNRARPIGANAVGTLPSDISDFREYIAKKYRSPAVPPDKGQG